MSILFKTYNICVTQGDPFGDMLILVHTLSSTVWLGYAFKLIQNNTLFEYIEGCVAFLLWFVASLVRDLFAFKIPNPQCNSDLIPSIYGFPHADIAFLVTVLTQILLQECKECLDIRKCVIYFITVAVINVVFYYAYLGSLWQIVGTSLLFIIISALIHKLLVYFFFNKNYD